MHWMQCKDSNKAKFMVVPRAITRRPLASQIPTPSASVAPISIAAANGAAALNAAGTAPQRAQLCGHPVPRAGLRGGERRYRARECNDRVVRDSPGEQLENTTAGSRRGAAAGAFPRETIDRSSCSSAKPPWLRYPLRRHNAPLSAAMNYQMLSQALGEQMGPGTQAGAQVRAPLARNAYFRCPSRRGGSRSLANKLANVTR